MAIDIEKYRERGLSRAEIVKNLKEAYTLVSPLTNMPYVECEKENYNDRTLLFASKATADRTAADYEDDGVRVNVKELRTVEIYAPVKGETAEPQRKKLYLNQVRQHLGILPFIGTNEVYYYPADGDAYAVPLRDLLPEGFEKKVAENPLYQPNLQLTGLYLMQEARRKKEWVDQRQLQALDEEFSSNLAKSRLFIALIPPEGKEKEQKLDLKECRLPYLKHQNGQTYFPLFTDVWEFQKYTKGKKNIRSIQVPFQDVLKFRSKDVGAYMLNPLGFSLPLSTEMIPRILQRFGVESGPAKTTKPEKPSGEG
ncbi:MAG: SseB family protein [Lachnospiraceae bacterium]|nr:SseB family protein [Lachnospiraceae bacterium]